MSRKAIFICFLLSGCVPMPKKHFFDWDSSDYGVRHRSTESADNLQRKTEK